MDGVGGGAGGLVCNWGGGNSLTATTADSNAFCTSNVIVTWMHQAHLAHPEHAARVARLTALNMHQPTTQQTKNPVTISYNVHRRASCLLAVHVLTVHLKVGGLM